MKHVLVSLFCLLFSVSALAQTPQPKAIRLYRLNDQLVLTDSLGNAPASYPTSQVAVRALGGFVEVVIGTASLYYRPTQLLDNTGQPYGTTVKTAISAYLATIPASGGTGSVTTSTTATFGSVQPSVVDYTTSATITTTSVIDMLIENVGTGTATLTYGGVPYSMASGEQRRFQARTDPTSGKLSPYPTITVNGTASTVRVIKTFQQ